MFIIFHQQHKPIADYFCPSSAIFGSRWMAPQPVYFRSALNLGYPGGIGQPYFILILILYSELDTLFWLFILSQIGWLLSSGKTANGRYYYSQLDSSTPMPYFQVYRLNKCTTNRSVIFPRNIWLLKYIVFHNINSVSWRKKWNFMSFDNELKGFTGYNLNNWLALGVRFHFTFQLDVIFL